MKYLRKIFESSKEDQIEDIESIFTEYLDTKYIADDGEEYSDCYISTENPKFIEISITQYLSSPSISDISDFDNIYKERNDYLELLKKIRTSLTRIDRMGYNWTMEFNEDGFFIKVLYKDTEVSLADCFGGESSMNHVEEAILKKYVKDKYNIEYSSYYKPSTSGYYGHRAEFLIYFKNPVPQTLLEDIKNLNKRFKVFSTHAEGEQIRVERAFYSVEVMDGNPNGIRIKI